MTMRLMMVLGAVAVLAGCAATGGTGRGASGSTSGGAAPEPTETDYEYVKLVTTKGVIVLELDPDHAPLTVSNFLTYVDSGAYNGTIFHRVIPRFVVQGGGYNTDFVELPSDPPIELEWPNGLTNSRGTIAMAREAEPNTATRQFYINVANNGQLDTAREKTGNAGYAVFGRVVDGMHVVDLIRDGKTTSMPDLELEDVPVDPVVITTATRITDQEAAKYWK